ncbi:sigma-54-dependent transcriptional regulator [Desulfovibrio ferrophilus]|uniref:DNA-binding transcriptional regulator NtrC n=1 Tax=Desulfovibrio ferrophilus TaxID=241368 RepID=A0A2Z6B0N3_9BACT|nr:sigma-54 dependent transcriptional regulator [Desulfovibrio ferrophilus]BBD09069.1 response regulator with CheY-like receiver [Desulfovibrio ferrophilus]
MASILIVDDDAQLRQSFDKLLMTEGHSIRVAASGEAGLEEVKAESPDLVIMDVRLPGMNGLETFAAMRGMDPHLPVIIMTAYGTTETAIEATKLGAFDYILKPFEIPAVLKLIGEALKAGRFTRSRVEVDARPESASSDALIGRSQVMQEVYKAIGRVAPTDATVMIRGESGTGKELVSRAVYQHSLRAEQPFLVINCVAIPETLLESELFGYEKGAFTGASSRRVGKIEQAHRGTILLDEIGDMPVSIQAKILRLLQEKKIERLGSGHPVPVDVRIIAATNRDLEAAVADGRFREDLYYRLKVVTLHLPPLRERVEDIPLLTDYFLARFARDMDSENPGLTTDGLARLTSHSWPGNVRELSNALKNALIFSRGAPLNRDDVDRALESRESALRRAAPPTIKGDPLQNWVHQAMNAQGNDNLFDTLMDEIGTRIIAEALTRTGGNRTQAAKLLGISRPTLIARIEKYGLKVGTSVSHNGSSD